MSGTVTWEVLAWVVGILMAAFAAAAVAIGWAVGQLSKRDAAIAAVARDLGMQVAAEHARAKMAEEEMARSLAAHKLYAAEHYATDAGLKDAVDRVDDAVKRLTDRMDNYFAEGTQPRQRPSG